MTEKDALRRFLNLPGDDIVVEGSGLIEKIYEDFDNQICGTCKHFYTPKIEEYKRYTSCTIGIAMRKTPLGDGVHWHFGCKRWEAE